MPINHVLRRDPTSLDNEAIGFSLGDTVDNLLTGQRWFLEKSGQWAAIPAGGGSNVAGNPTATIGTAAVNGVASTYMRSDAAPAVPEASSSTFGIVKVDGSSITAVNGVISSSGGGGSSGANPTATAGAVAVNGSASTFLRSDGAPAVAVATATVAGLVPTPPNNTTTFLRGDATFAAPPSGAVGGNPTGTIGVAAVNGSATTFLRSDGAPAVPEASSSTFGVVKVDGSTIVASSGVISAIGGAATSIVVGTTTIGSGSNGDILYDNGGVLGNFGLGTGVATALSVNVDSAGSFEVKKTPLSKTTNYNVLASDNNTFFDNTGASGEVDFALPTYAAGLIFYFTVTAAQILKIIAPASNKIAIGATNSATAGNILNNTPYSTICIFATTISDQWAAMSMTGNWTVN